MKQGLDLSEVPPESAVILPELTCEALAQPFRQRGHELVFHKLKPDLTPDWNDINSLVTRRVAVLVMINFFGNMQDVARYKDFTRKNRLILVEDSAHGAFGSYQGQKVGTLGDIGVTSERKIVETNTGASLFVQGLRIDPPISWARSEPPQRSGLTKKILSYRNHALLGTSLSFALDARRSLREITNNFEPKQPPFRANKEDIEVINARYDNPLIDERRDRWLQVNEIVNQEKRLIPAFFELTRGANPWGYPMWWHSRWTLIDILALQRKSGLTLRPWPTLPVEVRRTERRTSSFRRLLYSPLSVDSSVGPS